MSAQYGTQDAALFAKLVAARESRGELALLGLSSTELAALFARHFPGRPALVPENSQPASSLPREHARFVATLQALLLQYVNPHVDHADAACLATIIAHACLRPDHLWRDLGLSGREEVSAMLTRFFPSLVGRNVRELRWKKFLAQELALSEGREPGPAPGCPGCEDYGFCFPRSAPPCG
jgi:nitrogen fixation protein NifQ